MNTKILFAFFFVFFSLFSVTGVHAQQMTEVECGTQTGTCNGPLTWSNSCDTDEDKLGICTDTLFQAACCKPKTSSGGTVNIGTTYTPLENVPLIKGTTFQAYVEGIYNLALVLIVLCAVFMLTIGGFTYLTSAGNTAAISSAKHIIYGSLIGLVLALVRRIADDRIDLGPF